MSPLGPLGPQHLSDEAVAACADGVLTGHARARAMRHVAECAECAEAVRVQRETAFVLRSAPAPDLPTDLLDRLRGLPAVTPVHTAPTVVMPDGSTMLATSTSAMPSASRGRLNAPMAAFVDPSARPDAPARRRRAPFTVLAVAAALVGATATAAAVPDDATPGTPGTENPVRTVQHRTDGTPGNGLGSLLPPVGLFGPGGR